MPGLKSIVRLEAALWSFRGIKSFEQAILPVANLGDDADTTAAICGLIAGEYYRESGIPNRWLGQAREAGDNRRAGR